MEWHYAKDGDAVGPVTEKRLRVLHAEGTINDDSLVWHDRLDEWQPYRQLFPPEPAREDSATGEPLEICAVSGESLPRSRMLPYGDRWVMPEHKETFVQQLQEGSDSASAGPDNPFVADMGLASIVSQSCRIWWRQLPVITAISMTIWLPLCFLLEYFSYHVWADDFASIGKSFRMERSLDHWFGVIATAGIYTLVFHAWRGDRISYGDAMLAGLSHWPRLWGTRFLFFLMIVIFAIPAVLILIAIDMLALQIFIGGISLAGILWAVVRFGFCEVAAVSNEAGGVPAFTDSFRVTSKRFWRILIYQALVGTAVVMAAIPIQFLIFIPEFDKWYISGALSATATAILTLLTVEIAVLYRHLEATEESET